MHNINLKKFLWIIIILSAGIWFIISYLRGLDLSNITDFFGLIPEVITFDLVVITIFVKWLWQWQLLRGWLVPFPNLNGTWLGEIRSEWSDKEKNIKMKPIPAMLTVKQTFFNINCVMQTKEMRSNSYGEDFQIDNERQIKQLVYSYVSEPRINLQDRSKIHYGSVLLEIIETPKLKLKGKYWTDRKTIGEIELKYYSNKILEELPNMKEFTKDCNDT